jgi:hypothetical protein
MAITEPYAPRAKVVGRARRRGLFGGGTDGNARLTALTGTVLLILFAVLGITILRIGQLLWLHLFLGVLLVGPVGLKLASTGYRFTRYYTANPAYRRKGPPHPALRALGPVVILTTLAVFFTGLLLLVDGPGSSGTLRLAHKLSFFLWLGSMALHVLGHLLELPVSKRVMGGKAGRVQTIAGSRGRVLVLSLSLVAGLVLALLFLPDVHAWTSGGLYSFHHLGDH